MNAKAVRGASHGEEDRLWIQCFRLEGTILSSLLLYYLLTVITLQPITLVLSPGLGLTELLLIFDKNARNVTSNDLKTLSMVDPLFSFLVCFSGLTFFFFLFLLI